MQIISRVAALGAGQLEPAAGRSPSDHRVAPGPDSSPAAPIQLSSVPRARRGRPPKMSSHEVLERIRRLADSREGLFRVHRRNSGLYARARRSFGSWSAAVEAAGLDYIQALNGARQRSLRTRRRRTRLPDPSHISQ